MEYPYIQKVYALYNAEHKVENVHLPMEKHDYSYSKSTAADTMYGGYHEMFHRDWTLKGPGAIDILTKRIIHPKYLTGIQQFTVDWKVAPQIKFDIVWRWDRFSEDGIKASAEDSTSYGHNVEFAWLLMHAMKIVNIPFDVHQKVI